MRSGTPLALGIDLGTGSTKAIVLGAGGTEAGVASAPVRISNPHPGWAETSPEEWWASVKAAVAEAVAGQGDRVGAIGLSGQMHGVVLARPDGAAVRPALLWLDRRAEASLAAYRDLPSELSRCLGNPFVPGMAGPILHWLAQNEPASLNGAAFALQAKDWLRLRLVGQAGSEPSDASGTLLFDIFRGTWAGPLAEALGVPARLLAPLGPSGTLAGELCGPAAADLGLPVGTPVAYGAADTAAALIGGGLVDIGPVQLTVGSGAQLVSLRDQPRPDAGLRYHVFASALPGRWYALAAVQAAGVALTWALDVLDLTWDEAYGLFGQAGAGTDDGPLFVPHLAGARSPSMNYAARGAFCGLELRHGRPEMVRSVFEGVAFSILEAAQALPEFGAAPSIYLAGGGSTRAQWRQMLSSVLGKRLLVLESANASAKGAALLGGHAAGIFAEARGTLDVVQEVDPVPEAQEAFAGTFRRWQEVAGGHRADL